MTSDEFVLGKEAIVRRLLLREVPAEWEERPEAVPDGFQAGQSAGRARLERRVVTAKRWVKVVNGDGERCGSVARAALLDICDGGLTHESLLLVPERLQNGVFFSWFQVRSELDETPRIRNLPACNRGPWMRAPRILLRCCGDRGCVPSEHRRGAHGIAKTRSSTSHPRPAATKDPI